MARTLRQCLMILFIFLALNTGISVIEYLDAENTYDPAPEYFKA